MKKLALILGMFIALTCMSMNSVQAETTTWMITHHCIHDTNNVCLGAQDIEPFVVTVVAKADEGDYGTISMDNEDQTTYSLTELSDIDYGTNSKTFSFRGLDVAEPSVELLFLVTFYYQEGKFNAYLSIKYPDKILNYDGELLELEDPETEA